MASSDENTWWIPAVAEGEKSLASPFAFDAWGLFDGNFLPPPPRPPFLDETAQFDGLTTCGMCSWANNNNFWLVSNRTVDIRSDWVYRAMIGFVAIVSALVGAFAMVFLLKCKRFKTNATTATPIPFRSIGGGSGIDSQGDNDGPQQRVDRPKLEPIHPQCVTTNNGVWSWLGHRRMLSGSETLSQPSTTPAAENHYTHMDDTYNPEFVEALYAELDRESLHSENPSYNNTAFNGCTDSFKDLQNVSSAPSSAYYSDLSVTTVNLPVAERAYEVVGVKHQHYGSMSKDQGEFRLNLLSPQPNSSVARRNTRLSAISESRTISQQSPDFV